MTHTYDICIVVLISSTRIPFFQFGDGNLSFNYATNDTRKRFQAARSSSQKFEDDDFLLEDKVMNYGNDTADQILCVSDKGSVCALML